MLLNATRRALLLGLGLTWGGLQARPNAPSSGVQALQFPRDLGSHPAYAIEWWYLTGRLRAKERTFGFQLTFFRSRVAGTQQMTSNFAAKQLMFAHAAITDVQGKKLLHDQRIARTGFGVAQTAEGDTRIALRDWSLVRGPSGYSAHMAGPDFGFTLQLQETQALLLQGEQGWSRKGPQAAQASYYYSLPQLKTSGILRLQGREFPVQGTAWLDHEWSQSLLDPQAVGWDWIGMNLLDGSALTAFQLRDKAGAAVWDGGSFRPANQSATPQTFARGEVVFKPLRFWTSTLTQARYPVEWQVQTPGAVYTVKAVIDPQELDSRNSTGAVYWEGLSELFNPQGQLVGHGYLEMTGYAGALRLG